LVAVVRAGEDVELAVRNAVELAGGLEGIVTSKSKILVKPNVASRDRSGTGKITDARVTRAITKIVLEKNPRSVTIGEGSAIGFDFPERQDTVSALEESGTKTVAEELGVPLVDLNADDHEEVEVPQPLVMESVKIAQTVLDSNVIISVPVLKTHIRSAVTLSLKNMKGAMPGEEKKKTHRLGLEMAIADLNSVIRPHFVVVDGLMGMEGLWEYPDDCVPMGLVGAGRDPVAVDATFARIAGVTPGEIAHLRHSQKKGLGAFAPEEIEVAGVQVSEVLRPFRRAFEVLQSRYPGLKILAEKACTGCTNEFISTLIYLREAQQVGKLKDLTVIMGEGAQNLKGGKAVVLGNCGRNGNENLPHVPGCPPKVDDITRKVCEVCDIDVKLVFAKRDELHRLTSGKGLR